MSNIWVFENYGDAWGVLRCMKARISECGVVTTKYLAKLIELDGISNANARDNLGWTNLSSARIYRRCMNGQIELVLPEPTIITPPSDSVDHPNHYQSETGLEVIEVIEAFTANLSGIEAWDTGNVLKYTCRWKDKNGVEDLKKAKWYLEDLIEHVERRKE